MARPKRRIGLKTIADQAGVSVATVSLALSDHPDVNDNTKQRVRDLSREMGYITDRDMAIRKARRKVNRLGFVAVGNRLHDGHQAFLDPLTREARDYGMQILPVSIQGDTRAELIANLLEFGGSVDALLITDAVDRQMLKDLDKLEKPCLSFGFTCGRDDEPGSLAYARILAPNDTATTRWATSWLFRQGHQRIAFAAPMRKLGGSDDRQFDGWRLACLDNGHFPGPADVYEGPGIEMASEEVADFFLEQDSFPDAFYVTDPRLARKLIEGCHRHGRDLLPEHVVVRGPRIHLEEAGLLHHPHIEMDVARMARTAAAIMARPDRRVLEEGIHILFQLPTHNFS